MPLTEPVFLTSRARCMGGGIWLDQSSFKMNFIGRESELNTLSQGLAPSGTMRAAYISGEQGMGSQAC